MNTNQDQAEQAIIDMAGGDRRQLPGDPQATIEGEPGAPPGAGVAGQRGWLRLLSLMGSGDWTALPWF